jgi:hypothetical protein
MSDGLTPAGRTPVAELPRLARRMMVRAGDDPGPLRLDHLRCKPGRATVARLRPELEVPPRGGLRPGPPLWLSVEAPGAGPASASVHGFGDDPALPALMAAWLPEPGGEVWEALERAAALLTGAPARLVAATTAPIRYKPGSRCVLRYTLELAGGVTVTVFGKLLAAPLQAVAVDAITRRLHAEQVAGGEPPVVPRPLGVVETAGLALTAAGAEGDGVVGPLLPGIRVLLPCRHGAGAAIPVLALVAAAEGISRLHSSTVALRGGIGVVRTAAGEAERARDRAATLAGFVPALAPRITAITARLAARLQAEEAGSPVPCHGGFKPSQLVYCAGGRVVLTDLDGLCLADPALDLGYFLAYLRPLSVWRERPWVETWFAFAASAFVEAYSRSMLRRGTPPAQVRATLERVPLYEGALLLKIAARRPQRLNAPRPAELAAVLDDIHQCLSASRRAA